MFLISGKSRALLSREHDRRLQDDELRLFSQLRSADYVRRFARVAGVGRGEAAALAIAVNRGCGFATDDQDAIEVALGMRSDLSIHRIRALLLQAVVVKLISKAQARELHAAMIEAGSWDRGAL